MRRLVSISLAAIFLISLIAACGTIPAATSGPSRSTQSPRQVAPTGKSQVDAQRRQQTLEADTRTLTRAVRNVFESDLISVEVSEASVDLQGNFVFGEGTRARIVDVVFEGDDLFTIGLIKSGIELDMAKGYKAIFTSGVPVRVASIEAHMPFQSGSFGPVYGTHLWYAASSRINWGRSETYLLVDVPEVWEVYLLNSSFQGR